MPPEAAAPQGLVLSGSVTRHAWPTPSATETAVRSGPTRRPPGVGERWSLQTMGERAAEPPIALEPVAPSWATPETLPGSVLDCCVRLPGGPILWPDEFAALWPVLAGPLAQMAAGDPTAEDEAYLYITVDRRAVAPGETGRRGGWHLDGLQGARYAAAPLPVCHQLLLYDCVPTLFALQAFDVTAIDVSRDNVFHALSAQVQEEAVRAWPIHTPLWTSAYHVHASAPAEEAGWRHFVRLEISRKQADRTGNTIHPHLSATWAWQPRPIPEHLLDRSSQRG